MTAPRLREVAAPAAPRDTSIAAARGEVLRRRLVSLMVSRLGLALAVLALALFLLGAGHEGAERAERGLYGTLALAFGSTALYAVLLPRVRKLAWLGAAQVVTDVALVTSLVAFSGGVHSIFGFLYLPIPVYCALLFGRPGAYGSAALGAAGYAAALLAAGSLFGTPEAGPPGLVLAGLHAGALLLVALLASGLAAELQRAGERLDARTVDLEALRSLHERTIASLTSGLLTVDRDGQVTSFNPEAERITGRSAARVAGRSLDEVLPGAAEVLGGRSEAARGGRGRRRLAFVDAEGKERFLGLASSVLRDADDEQTGLVVIFQDVTQVVAMERELHRNERLAGVGQLAAGMAHEIRNPLAAISGSVEILESGLDASGENDERRRLMGIVLREIERLDGLITDFLQYARPTPPKLESVLLAPLLEDLAEMARAALPEGVVLTVEADADLSALADATQLRQALWNLVTNAQQAVGENGVIRLRTEAREGARPESEPPATSQAMAGTGRNEGVEGSPGVEIVVSDDGSGIPVEHLDRIFDPFFTTKAGGTGLGLPTVHRIVEAHGGVLQVDSEAERGTEFRVRLLAAG